MILAGIDKIATAPTRVILDYSYWLRAATLDTVTTTVVPADTPSPLVIAVTKLEDNTQLQLFFSGGTVGETYNVEVAVLTSNGVPRTDTVQITVKDSD